MGRYQPPFTDPHYIRSSWVRASVTDGHVHVIYRRQGCGEYIKKLDKNNRHKVNRQLN